MVPSTTQNTPGSRAELTKATPGPSAAAGAGTSRGVAALAGAIGTYGVSIAVMNTTTSLFLANAVHAAALGIGLFFAGRGVIAIVVNLVMGRLSDRSRDRRAMLAYTAVAGALGSLSFAAFRGYVAVFLTGAVLFSLGGVTFSQLFAYSKELAEARGRSVTSFGSTMRSVFSASWVVGPPFGFFLLNQYGFGPTYVAAAGLCMITAIAALLWLPRVPAPAVPAPVRAPSVPGARPGRLGRSILLLLAATTVLSVVNQMYSIDIALYVTKDLHLGASLVGWMAGLGAGLEIPIMIAVGRIADRVGKLRLVIAAAAGAAVFFCLLPLAGSVPALLALQVLNAAWVAVAMSIPMLMVQQEVPGGAGTSSSLYSSAYTIAGLVSGAATGVTAAAVGYRDVFWVCAGLSVLATVLLAARRRLS
jgi:MFS transporter, SET family, sugar efflux transporter